MASVPEIVTSNIIEQLERGVAAWRKPWSTSIPRNLISKKPYRGLNVFLLATQGYGSPYWVTFNQAKQLGAHVRKGENSTLVSFWKFNEYARENRETGETESKTSVLLRYYRVFNIEQCEGLKALHGDENKPVDAIAECESIANQMAHPPRFEQHSQAFYRHRRMSSECDAWGNRRNLTRHPRQLCRLLANVDSAAQIRFAPNHLRGLTRPESSRLHPWQNDDGRG